MKKLIDRLWEQAQTQSLLPAAIVGALLSPRFESFVRERFRRWQQGPETRRHWLLSLGLSWLAGLIVLVAIYLASHYASYLNLWTWMWAGAREQEPPMWIFWLGDARYQGLLFAFVIGFLPAMITGWGGWMWIFVPAAVFPGILSLPGAWILLLTERFALWLRLWGSIRDPQAKSDLLLRAALSLLVILAVLLTGPALRAWIQLWTGAELLPDARLVQVFLGLGLITAGETLVVMIAMHFVWRARSDTRQRS